MKLVAPLAVALCGAVGLAGCASTSQLSPTAEADIADAYQVICGPGAPATISGIVGIAQASSTALPASAQSAINTALSVCAAGVPDNEVVAGVDIFNLLVEIESFLPAKSVPASTKAHLRALAKRHHLG